MRPSALRILLPLTILVAAPILGWSGSAQAGYVEPVSLVAAPHSHSFTTGAPQVAHDEMGMAAESTDSAHQGNPRCEEEQALLASGKGSSSKKSP